MYLPACNISSQLSIVPRILENFQKKKEKRNNSKSGTGVTILYGNIRGRMFSLARCFHRVAALFLGGVQVMVHYGVSWPR